MISEQIQHRFSTTKINVLPTKTVRVSVPLLNTGMSVEPGKVWTGRFQVAPDVWLASLDDQETQRILTASGLAHTPMNACRLELHNVTIAFDPVEERSPGGPGRSSFVDIRPVLRVETILGLLSLCVRMAPAWPGVVYDVQGQKSWVRDAAVYAWGGFYRGKYSYLPMGRLRTWARLVEAWPHHVTDTVDQALGYYYQSIVDRPEHPAKGLTSAAIAFESLLGRGLQQELSHRLSNRAALLVARGSEAREISSIVKRWYTIRSKLVHDAVTPDPADVVHFQQFLMRAIPSMARLIQLTGSHQNAIAALDDAPYERSGQLDSLFEPDGWWNYVDVLTALDRPAL